LPLKYGFKRIYCERSPEAVRDTDNDIPLVKLAEVSVAENSATGSVTDL